MVEKECSDSTVVAAVPLGSVVLVLRLWPVAEEQSRRSPFSETGALMFEHADAGECPAASVLIPVRLALPLQSPSGTTG